MHDAHAGLSRAHDDLAKVGVQFGRSTRDVERRNPGAGEKGKTSLHDLAWHDLRAVRPGIDMAVPARLVASLPDVDLENFYLRRPQRPQPGTVERGFEPARQRDVGESCALRRP